MHTWAPAIVFKQHRSRDRQRLKERERCWEIEREAGRRRRRRRRGEEEEEKKKKKKWEVKERSAAPQSSACRRSLGAASPTTSSFFFFCAWHVTHYILWCCWKGRSGRRREGFDLAFLEPRLRTGVCVRPLLKQNGALCLVCACAREQASFPTTAAAATKAATTAATTAGTYRLTTRFLISNSSSSSNNKNCLNDRS